MPVELLCATSNENKLREYQRSAGDAFTILGLPPVPCPEVGSTFEDNAVAKALAYSQWVLGQQDRDHEKSPFVFADDSGLVVDSLGGAPGIHSARFAGEDADDDANNALLLDKLARFPRSRQAARFVCCIALARVGRIVRTFEAEVGGYILEKRVGEGGFGYDPLFYLPELGATFAELSPEEKWLHGHRGHAFHDMVEWLGQTELNANENQGCQPTGKRIISA